MESYIVKVRAYDGGSLLKCGTGIVVRGGRAVLTAKHVACGEMHTIVIDTEDGECEIKAEDILLKNEAAVILSVREPLSCESADIFSDQEILEIGIPWTVKGYITNAQHAHEIKGSGLIQAKLHDEDWDCELDQIYSGLSQSYKGLSGAPVLSFGRIVGILQIHLPFENGVLGLKMSSVNQFRELLEDGDLKANEYELAILKKSQEMSFQHIEQNKESGKYIPNIFVEENDCKEKLRYFAEPCRFWKKAVEEFRRVDFSEQNRQLIEQHQPSIEASGLSEASTVEEIERVQAQVTAFLEKTKSKLKLLSSSTRAEGISVEEYYVRRENGYNALEFFVQDIEERLQMAGKSYLLLTKYAGQGKTNLICDFTENFLLKKDYCVWYYNAYELRESPMTYLKREWSINGQYDPVYGQKILEQRWRRTGKPAVLVIDGLNENMAVLNFGQCMRDFLEECVDLSYLKVIMTTRKELLKERFSVLLEMEKSGKFLHLPGFQTGKDFKQRIFNGYLRFFDVDIRIDTLTRTTYQMLTKDILLLRFFCEVETHKRQVYMYHIYKYEVFQRYLKKKADEYRRIENFDITELFYDLLNHICRNMLDKKIYVQLSISDFSRDEQQLMNQMLENDVIFKSEVQLEKGLLKRGRTVISFTFDEFRDFCLTNYILEQSEEKSAFMERWRDLHENHAPICEGVERYTFFYAATNNREKLLPWLKECPEYKRLYWENIWDVEDRYLTEEDLICWKNHIFQEGPYSTDVVGHLFFRADNVYFKTANIQVLLDVMSEILKDLGKYTKFIHQMFAPRKKDKHGLYMQSYGKALPYNDMLSQLSECLKKRANCYIEYFRMTIYLYELLPKETQKVWGDLFLEEPESAISILKEANVHSRSLIRGNGKDILMVLLDQYREGPYGAELVQLYEENDFGRNFSGTLKALAKIFT